MRTTSLGSFRQYDSDRGKAKVPVAGKFLEDLILIAGKGFVGLRLPRRFLVCTEPKKNYSSRLLQKFLFRLSSLALLNPQFGYGDSLLHFSILKSAMLSETTRACGNTALVTTCILRCRQALSYAPACPRQHGQESEGPEKLSTQPHIPDKRRGLLPPREGTEINRSRTCCLGLGSHRCAVKLRWRLPATATREIQEQREAIAQGRARIR